MIPKVIHYCWFGHGEMSKLMKKCIKSWKKYCPDYQIIEWNEENFDVNSCLWTKQAYEAKKWAFVSDYARLKVLYEQGGIYMDTDVELVKPLDALLNHKGFSGFENSYQIQSGIIGVEKGHVAVKKWLDYYENREYLIDGQPIMQPNVSYMTDIFLENGLVLDDSYQEICDMAIYPQTYFCPLHTDTVKNCITDKTFVLHHFTGTWMTPKGRKDAKRQKRHSTKWYKFWIWLRYLPNRIVRKIFGDKTVDKLKGKLKK